VKSVEKAAFSVNPELQKLLRRESDEEFELLEASIGDRRQG